jgi:hypothetical protein
MVFPLSLLLAFPSTPVSADRIGDIPALAVRIDSLTAAHWQARNVTPAPSADDATFLRRLTLDLVGRIPTYREARAFADERSPDKRVRAIRRLMESPEYPLQMGRVLDEVIQDKFAGEPEFLGYLRGTVAARVPWDQIFRDVMLGPWDAKESKNADRFLVRRLNSLDDLTNDSARAFFGVNVSCAKCHDHPLVQDWTQDHYYGMASFFNPTYEGSKGKGKGRNGNIQEKATSPVSYVTTKGERRNAKIMFLSSRILEDAAANSSAKPDKSLPPGRRDLLVKVGLEEKNFFSRSIVNRLWAYFLGRGLVHPVDQMHSANPPAIPGVLEAMADDLASHGYDLDRLVAALVMSRVYGLASSGAGEDAEKDFAVARLRPLSPQQFALSLMLATGEETLDQATSPEDRTKRYRELEGQAERLTKTGLLDPRTDVYQTSTGEAMFLSNGGEVQRLMQPNGKNLAARLSATTDTGSLVDTAVWTLLARAPEAEERTYLIGWLDKHKQDRTKACAGLIWSLATSAEFRFNH